MYDAKFKEPGALAEVFGFKAHQLNSSTKYMCKYNNNGCIVNTVVLLSNRPTISSLPVLCLASGIFMFDSFLSACCIIT